jgi:hypothetical protein
MSEAVVTLLRQFKKLSAKDRSTIRERDRGLNLWGSTELVLQKTKNKWQD